MSSARYNEPMGARPDELFLTVLSSFLDLPHSPDLDSGPNLIVDLNGRLHVRAGGLWR